MIKKQLINFPVYHPTLTTIPDKSNIITTGTCEGKLILDSKKSLVPEI